MEPRFLSVSLLGHWESAGYGGPRLEYFGPG